MAIDVRPEVLVRRARQDDAEFMFDPANDLRWTGGNTASTPTQPGLPVTGASVERTAHFLGRTFTYGLAIRATGTPGRFFGWATPLMKGQVRKSITAGQGHRGLPSHGQGNQVKYSATRRAAEGNSRRATTKRGLIHVSCDRVVAYTRPSSGATSRAPSDHDPTCGHRVGRRHSRDRRLPESAGQRPGLGVSPSLGLSRVDERTPDGTPNPDRCVQAANRRLQRSG